MHDQLWETFRLTAEVMGIHSRRNIAPLIGSVAYASIQKPHRYN